MPKGKTHENLLLKFIPFVLVIFFFIGVNLPIRLDIYGLLVINAYLIGGYFFSPDLDIDSSVYRRWGIFRWIWLPYKNLISHRSKLSHGILIGTIIRILYFFILISIIFMTLIYISIGELPIEQYLLKTINYTIINKYYFLSILLAFELSADVHIFSDRIYSFVKKMKRVFILNKKGKKVRYYKK